RLLVVAQPSEQLGPLLVTEIRLEGRRRGRREDGDLPVRRWPAQCLNGAAQIAVEVGREVVERFGIEQVLRGDLGQRACVLDENGIEAIEAVAELSRREEQRGRGARPSEWIAGRTRQHEALDLAHVPRRGLIEVSLTRTVIDRGEGGVRARPHLLDGGRELLEGRRLRRRRGASGKDEGEDDAAEPGAGLHRAWDHHTPPEGCEAGSPAACARCWGQPRSGWPPRARDLE